MSASVCEASDEYIMGSFSSTGKASILRALLCLFYRATIWFSVQASSWRTLSDMEAISFLRRLPSRLLTPQRLLPTSTQITTRLSIHTIKQDQQLLLLPILQQHLCLSRLGTVATLGTEGR